MVWAFARSTMPSATASGISAASAPMLLVNGKEDKQVPVEDFYLLLEHGNPKTIRLFPGGHMGNIPFVFETVIPWLHKRFEAKP